MAKKSSHKPPKAGKSHANAPSKFMHGTGAKASKGKGH